MDLGKPPVGPGEGDSSCWVVWNKFSHVLFYRGFHDS